MLAIRMQRTGRKGHAQFRIVVQDSRKSPTSGRLVAHIGHYNPHSKALTLQKAEAERFLHNGAQPSDKVAQLLQQEGIKLPKWVKLAPPKERAIRNPEKLRKNRPAEPETPEAEATADTPAEAPAEEAPAKEATEKATEEPAEENTNS